MQRHALFAVILAIGWFATAFPQTAFAWGREGHEIIGYIAEKHLTAQAKAGVRALLGAGAHLSDHDVADWADEIRNHRHDTASWHFVDIPIEAARYDPARDCRRGKCVVERIEHFASALADKHASNHDRAEALKFLVHFVGDVHQPLHCAERNHDRGGNACEVVFLGQRANLHHVWDDELVYRISGSNRFSARSAADLGARITSQQTKEWAQGDLRQWAEESHRLARDFAYAGVPASAGEHALGRPYLDRCAPVVREQLQKAAIRLAALLNKAFE